MSMSESEYYEVGMSLPPAQRRSVSLRLLKSVGESDTEFDEAVENWLHTEVAAAYDALKADPSRAIPAEEVEAEFKSRRAAR